MEPERGTAAGCCIGGDDGDEGITPLDYGIAVSSVDYSLEDLHRKMSEREVAMPSFEGQYAWDIRRASRLIESFAMDLPVPPVFAYVQRDRTLLVVDGRHRLETVRRFFDDEFGGAGSQRFRLAGINPEGELCGRALSELGPVARRNLGNTLLRVVVIRQLDPDGSPAAIHHICERLHTGGMQLGAQEARNCIYAGRLSDLLDDLNGMCEWRRLLGMPRRDGRQRDAELILRYMALFHNLSRYKRPMRDFLSAFMHSHRDPADEFVCEERERFARACGALLDGLGGRPIGRRGRINPSVFDALFVTVAGSPDACRGGGLEDRVRRLLSDAEFIDSTTRATTDPRAVFKRMALARSALCG